VVGGVGFAVCTRTLFAGLAGSLLVLAVVMSLLATGLVNRTRREPVLWLAGAALLGALFSFRASPWLVVLNTLGAGTLLIVGALTAQRGSLFRLQRESFRDAAGVLFMAPFESLPLIGRMIKRKSKGAPAAPASEREGIDANLRSRSERRATALKSAFLAAPLLLVVVPLLSVGDAAFSDLVGSAFGSVGDGLSSMTEAVFTDSVWFMIGAWLTAALVVVSQMNRLGSKHTTVQAWLPTRPPVFGHREVAGALWLLAGTLALFSVTQVFTALGISATDGDIPSYREIAKNGFFALLAASVIVVLSLFGAHLLVGHRRWQANIRRPAQLNVLLTGVVVVVASRRLWIGADVWGLTMLRVLSQSAALLIGVVLISMAWWQHRPRPACPSLGVAILSALVVVVGLNLAPTEAMVVRWNAARPIPDESSRFSTVADGEGRSYELGVARCQDYYDKWHGMNDDAAQALAPLLLKEAAEGQVDPYCATTLLECDRNVRTTGLHWNWSRRRAEVRRRDWCAQFNK
jgi:hypothetical protein